MDTPHIDVRSAVQFPERLLASVRPRRPRSRRYQMVMVDLLYLRSDNIRIGQRLVIYRGGKGPSTGSTSQKDVSKPNPPHKSTVPMDADYTIYTVKSGDSLYLIAKNYPGVSAQNIMDFNGIGSRIKPGMKIKIPKL